MKWRSEAEVKHKRNESPVTNGTRPIDIYDSSGRLHDLMESLNEPTREAGLCVVVRNLSLSGTEALANLPAGLHRADALALSFDDQYTSFMESMTNLPGQAQLLSLQELDSALNAISGPQNAELWTDASFASDPRWNNIRSLAQKVLVEFGW